MKSIKLLVFICFAFSFSNCNTLKLTETPPFKITGATYHNWVGGQPGVSGTNLIIGVENDTNIAFIKIYFQNKVVDARIEDRKDKKYVIANIDTSNRREIGIESKEDLEEKIKKKSRYKLNPVPFNLEPNEAVISYMSGKKTYFYKVSKIKKTETIFYP
jgi:hypothetical protein